MAAPVAGPRMMMTANTTEPMAIGAQPGTARWSMTPKITHTSMNVPIASISEARPNPIVAALYLVTPPPAATVAARPRVRKMAAAPAIAPASWAATYPGTSRQGNLPETASASVTAGLMWPPEMCPIAYTAPTMTSMKANEIMPSWAMEKGTLVPEAITPVAAADPAPTYTRNAVPRPSARSFWVVVGGAVIRIARGLRRGVSPPSGEIGTYLKPVRHSRTVFHET